MIGRRSASRGIGPMAHVGEAAGTGLTMMRSGPDTMEPFIKVPKVLGEGEGGMRRILIGFLVATTLLVPACKTKTEGGNVVQLGADDPGLVAAAAEAKRRWPEFVAAFNEHRPGRKCAVKYAAPIKGGGDEQIWIMVTTLGSGTISGTLGNAPVAGHRAESRRCRDDPDGRRQGLAVHRRTVHDRRILGRDSPERRGQARAVHRRTVHDRRSLDLDSQERRGQARRQMNAGGRLADHRAALERR